MNAPENILIVRTDRIGDVVLSLPMASVIKKYFPNSKVTFLVREYTRDLVQNNSSVDEVLILEEFQNKIPLKKNIEKIKSKNFDVCFTVSPKFKIALILFLSKINKRIGTGYRWYSFLFNEKIYEHRKYAERHELEFNLRMVQKIGIDENPQKGSVSFNLQPFSGNVQYVQNLLKNTSFNQSLKTVIIHPGSGGSAVDLPVSSFVELTKMLASELNVNVIITGSENEKNICDKLKVNEKVINFAGKLNLGQLIALINKSDLMIANSTGPIHIAAALNKFVIGFYPKITASSEKRWGPYTKKKAVFTPSIECGNCTRKQCEQLECMSSINPGQVFNSVKNILAEMSEKNIK